MKKKENGKWNNKIGIGIITTLVFIFIGVSNMNAAGFLGIGNTASWKEEVLLHDGSKIIVERWQRHGGRREPGQDPDISDQSISFTIPGTNKSVKWKDEASDELGGRVNFDLVALHIINNLPYIITTPHLCLSYNKWGRPNPPYIIFKYEGNEWKQIDMTELPVEFKNINLVVNAGADDWKLVSQSIVSADMVKKLNDELTQKEYKTIARTPMEGVGCGVEVYDGTYWYGLSGLDKLPSYEACVKVCGTKAKYCPCEKYFKTDSKGEK